MHSLAANPHLFTAHVPQPPGHDIDTNVPPSIPPDAPDEIDLPPREDSPDIDEPETPPAERNSFRPGQRFVLN